MASSEDDVRAVFNHIMCDAVGWDAYDKIACLLWDDVLQDVKECSEFPDKFNDDDVRMALGRVLCRRLGVDYDN